MITPAYVRTMAGYNRWQNESLYGAAGKLTDAQRKQVRGAFFGSVLGTLNHIMVGEPVWLKRLATHPAAHRSLEPIRQREQPAALDQILHHDFGRLSGEREKLDAIIVAWLKKETE